MLPCDVVPLRLALAAWAVPPASSRPTRSVSISLTSVVDVAAEAAELADVLGPDRQLDGPGDGLVEAGVEQLELVLGVLRRRRSGGRPSRAGPGAPRRCSFCASSVSPSPRRFAGFEVLASAGRVEVADGVDERVAPPGDAPALARRRRRCARRSRRAGRAAGPGWRPTPPCGSAAARRAPRARTRATDRRSLIGSMRSPRVPAGQQRRDRGRARRRGRDADDRRARRAREDPPPRHRHRRARSPTAPSPRRRSCGSSRCSGQLVDHAHQDLEPIRSC